MLSLTIISAPLSCCQVRAAVDALLYRAAKKGCNAHCMKAVAAALACGWQQHSPPAASEAAAGSRGCARAAPGSPAPAAAYTTEPDQDRGAAGGAASAPAASQAAAGSPGRADAAPGHAACEPAHAPEHDAERSAASGGAGEAGGAPRAQVSHELRVVGPWGAGEGALHLDQRTGAECSPMAVAFAGSPGPDPGGRSGPAPARGSSMAGAAAAGGSNLLAGSPTGDLAAAAGAASDSDDCLELVGPRPCRHWCKPLHHSCCLGVLSTRHAQTGRTC